MTMESKGSHSFVSEDGQTKANGLHTLKTYSYESTWGHRQTRDPWLRQNITW